MAGIVASRAPAACACSPRGPGDLRRRPTRRLRPARRFPVARSVTSAIVQVPRDPPKPDGAHLVVGALLAGSTLLSWLAAPHVAGLPRLFCLLVGALASFIILNALRIVGNGMQALLGGKRQGDKSERVARLRFELATKVHQLSALDRQHEEECSAMNKIMQAATSQIAVLDAIIVALKASLAEERERVDHVQREAGNLQKQLESAASQQEADREHVKRLEAAHGDINRRLMSMKATCASSLANSERLTVEKVQLEQQLTSSQARHEQQMGAARQSLDVARKQIAELQAQLADLQAAQTQAPALAAAAPESLQGAVAAAAAARDAGARQAAEGEDGDAHSVPAAAAAGPDGSEGASGLQRIDEAAAAELQAAQAALTAARDDIGELQANLSTAQAENVALCGQVEQLTASVAEAVAAGEATSRRVAELEAEVARSQQLVSDANQQVQVYDQARASVEGRMERLQKQHETELAKAEDSVAAAVSVADAAKEKLEMTQKEISDVASEVLERAVQPVEMWRELKDALNSVEAKQGILKQADVRLWSMPGGVLSDRLAAKQRRSAVLREHIVRVELNVPARVQERVVELQQLVQETLQRREALAVMKIAEEREARQAALTAQVAEHEREVENLLARHLPSRLHKHLCNLRQELARSEEDVVALRAALEKPMKERLKHLLVHQVAVLRAIMQEEVGVLQEQAEARISAMKAEGEAAVQASMEQAEAAVLGREEERREAAAQEEARLDSLRKKTAVEVTALREDKRSMEAECAALAERQRHMQGLIEAYGPLEAVTAREAALEGEVEKLAQREDEVRAREDKVAEMWGSMSTQAEKATDELAQVRQLQGSVSAEQSRLVELEATLVSREGELARERETLTREREELERRLDTERAQLASEIGEHRAQLQSDVERMQDAAEAQVTAMRVDAHQEIEAQRKALVREQISLNDQRRALTVELEETRAALQAREQELKTMREHAAQRMQSSQQELGTAQQQARELRELLEARDAELLQLQSGQGWLAPTPDARTNGNGTGWSSGPAKGGRGGGGGRGRNGGGDNGGTDNGSAASVKEVSEWASQLLANLSMASGDRETRRAAGALGGSVATAGVRSNGASPSASSRLSRVSSPPTPTGTAALEVASPAAAPDVATGAADAEAVKLLAAGANIPHPKKRARGGEDAFFVLTQGMGAMGVSDGVGSWGQAGVDPGEYSRRLMTCAAQALARGEVSCVEALEVAHKEAEVPGSATAIVARLTPGNVLEVANLGDSGARVLRGGAVVYSSTALQHEFNMPYQLGHPNLLPATDDPTSALVDYADVRCGDLVIMGSDGIFDNLWDEDLEEIVAALSPSLGAAASAEALKAAAERLAAAAEERSRDKSFRSPFSVAANRAQGASAGFLGSLLNGPAYTGGKQDDITVIVAQVQ